MKKTITINLNNIVFTIDDDAYDMLKTYLSDIAAHLASDPEKDDIINDIEGRIAELFSERLNKMKNVINLSDVQQIKDILGNPSQFVDADGTADEAPKDDTSSEQSKKKGKRPFRFYRDPGNSILGGVCGGLAAYLRMDVTAVRIALVLVFFLSCVFGGGWFIVATYILLWIIAPQARTASQRLEMQGEEVTVENIKTELNNFKSYIESEHFKQSTKNIGDRIASIFVTLLKIAGGFFAAVFSLVGFVIVAALFVVLILLIFNPAVLQGQIMMSGWELLTQEKSIMLFVSLILVVVCPLIGLVYGIIRLISQKRSESKSGFWVLLLLWLAGLFMLISVSSKTIINFKNLDGESLEIVWGESTIVDELRVCERFHAIDVSGNFDLTLKQDTLHDVLISAYEGLLPKVKTEVRNGVLHISSTAVLLNTRPITLTVSLDSISAITARGACDLKNVSTITASNIAINLKGAVEADLNVEITDVVKLDLTGATQIKMNGTTQTLRINATGAGDIVANELKAQYVDVSLTGAANAKVYASERINVRAKGASDIKCFGNPEKVEKSIGKASSFQMR